MAAKTSSRRRYCEDKPHVYFAQGVWRVKKPSPGGRMTAQHTENARLAMNKAKFWNMYQGELNRFTRLIAPWVNQHEKV